MGAYRINVDLHDDQAEEFVSDTLDIDLTTLDREELAIYQTTARYIAQRLIDENDALAEALDTRRIYLADHQKTHRARRSL